MDQKNLSKWLKFTIIGTSLCGLIIYLWIVPKFGKGVVYSNPELAHYYLPWLILILITAVPCYLALLSGWIISCEIGNNNSFSKKNAILLKRISHLAMLDSIIFFMGNIIFLGIGISHPGITFLSLLIVFAGIAISIASAALSHLVLKAYEIQEENEGTV